MYALKYEVSINTSIHVGMRIHFSWFTFHYSIIHKMTFFLLLHLRCDGFILKPVTCIKSLVKSKLKVKLVSCSGWKKIYFLDFLLKEVKKHTGIGLNTNGLSGGNKPAAKVYNLTFPVSTVSGISYEPEHHYDWQLGLTLCSPKLSLA